jgi:hypothetical protein
MSKLISFAGYSRVAGELKFRTATDEKRIEQLAKLGDTDINIVKLSTPVATKNEAVKAVIQLYGNAEAEVTAFLTAQVKDENPFAKAPKAKREVRVKVKVAKKVKASEPRELTAKELAARQFIAFPVGNGGMAYYPNPMSQVAQDSDDSVDEDDFNSVGSRHHY